MSKMQTSISVIHSSSWQRGVLCSNHPYLRKGDPNCLSTVQAPVVNQHVCSQKSPLSKDLSLTDRPTSRGAGRRDAAGSHRDTRQCPFSFPGMDWSAIFHFSLSLSPSLMQMISRTDLSSDVETSIGGGRGKSSSYDLRPCFQPTCRGQFLVPKVCRCEREMSL